MMAMSYEMAFGNCCDVTSKIRAIIMVEKTVEGDMSPWMNVYVRMREVNIAGVVR